MARRKSSWLTRWYIACRAFTLLNGGCRWLSRIMPCVLSMVPVFISFTPRALVSSGRKSVLGFS